jgi:hypothetical protein
MNARIGRFVRGFRRAAVPAAALALALAWIDLAALPGWAQRPATDKHVTELARYLNGVKIAAPIMYRKLAVYPVLVEDVPRLEGGWLTLDAAIARGVAVVSEKGSGSVPVVSVENRSRNEHVFIMTGEVITGGMQTRTVRRDVALAPGQKVDLEVFCVEAHRWSGEAQFSQGSKSMLPQSIQGKVRGGTSQSGVWAEVHRNNAGLNAENATGSLDVAINAPPVRRKLDEVRRNILPQVPRGTTGFIFVSRGRAVGAELFGSEELARSLLPKLLDSYAVDYVLLDDQGKQRDGEADNRKAIEFFEQVCRAGSERATTPGSGSGIRTRQHGLLGDGVSLGGALVHYGVQIGVVAAQPAVQQQPQIIYPRQNSINR